MQNKIYKHYKKELNEIPSFLIGQKAFIVNNIGKVLIIKRHHKSTKSELWDLPGGRLDFKESLRSGLQREIKEESGLDLITVSIPLSITTFLRDIDRNTQIARIIYLCQAEGKIELSKEHSDYLWIDPNNYKDHTFIDQDYNCAFKNYLKFKPKLVEFLGEGMLEESLNILKSKK